MTQQNKSVVFNCDCEYAHLIYKNSTSVLLAIKHQILINFAEECGHIKLPDGVDQQFSNNDGYKRVDLSCRKTGYIFGGEKDPTPQYCFKGQWTYEVEGYDIPGCQGKI